MPAPAPVPDLSATDCPVPEPDWSLSFAGCGFMGLYYVGAVGCILQRCPELVTGATRVYGSSAGALLAAVLTTGIPLEKCCDAILQMASRARSLPLGPLNPAFDLMKQVRDFLVHALPADAHKRASGRLCVSVTKVSTRENRLVTDFSTNEELIQALVCSCFVPFYCGVVPPTYRGERFVDGAVSDNLPRCHQKKTITFSPYAGESDICPRPQGQLYMSQVRFNNVSIEVNPENLYRVTSTFFPPQPQVLSEICQNGFEDALRFLHENGLVNPDIPTEVRGRPPCCEFEHLFITDQSERSGKRMEQSERRGERTEQLERRGERTDQSEKSREKSRERTDQSERSRERTDQSLRSGERTDQSERSMERTDQSEQRGEWTDQSERSVERTDQSEKSGERTDQSEKSGERTDQSEKSGERTDQSERSRERMDQSQQRELKAHSWLDPALTEKLPPEIRAVLCAACRAAPPPSPGLPWLPVGLPALPGLPWLPVGLPGLPGGLPGLLQTLRAPWTMAHRLVECLPDTDMSWFYKVLTQIWRESEEELFTSPAPLRRCRSLPEGLSLFNTGSAPCATPEQVTPPLDLTWDQSDAVLPLTPPPTPTCSPPSKPTCSPASSTGARGWGFGVGGAVGGALGWIKKRTTAPPADDTQNK